MTIVPGQDDGWDIDLVIPEQQMLLGLELITGVAGTVDLFLGGTDTIQLQLGSDGPAGPLGPTGPTGPAGEGSGGGTVEGCCYIEADGPTPPTGQAAGTIWYDTSPAV